MERLKLPPNYENFTYTNRQSTVSPFSYLHIASSNSESNLISLRESPKSIIKNHQSNNNNNTFHQRCSSASSILLNIEDDQPSWLEDLLTDPKSPTFSQHICHHEILSDSSSLLEASYDIKSTSSDEKTIKDHNAQSSDSSGERSNSKTESKRTKQHSAHRSRVRKMKYIAELERTVQRLQVEGSEVRAELEFLNQQNLILGMENIALRKRLDSVSHEQLIKRFEQEMLGRELGRLQTLHQLQNQQMRIQQQIMQT